MIDRTLPCNYRPISDKGVYELNIGNLDHLTCRGAQSAVGGQDDGERSRAMMNLPSMDGDADELVTPPRVGRRAGVTAIARRTR